MSSVQCAIKAYLFLNIITQKDLLKTDFLDCTRTLISSFLIISVKLECQIMRYCVPALGTHDFHKHLLHHTLQFQSEDRQLQFPSNNMLLCNFIDLFCNTFYSCFITKWIINIFENIEILHKFIQPKIRNNKSNNFPSICQE